MSRDRAAPGARISEQIRAVTGVPHWVTGLFLVVVLLNVNYVLSSFVPGLTDNMKARVASTTVFLIVHACWALGTRRALAFFAMGAIVSWAFEHFGVITGAVFGDYVYSDSLGPKLGHVPVLIPLAWFMIMYPAHTMANIIFDGSLQGRASGPGRKLFLSLVAAMIITMWDLVIDPGMAEAGHWIWQEPGDYFGVPFQNFGGWMVTSVTVFQLYRTFEARLGPAAPAPTLGSSVVPMTVYALLALRYATDGRGALSMIAVFGMGLPVVIAAGRLFEPRRSD